MTEIADLRVQMTACRVDKEGRLLGLETWKKEQNGELKLIRKKGSATLVAIILLLIGVVVNLAVGRLSPVVDVEEVVQETIEANLDPLIEAIVHRVLESERP